MRVCVWLMQKWRTFAETYKEKLEEFNFGTLLRLDANGVYDDENTIFGILTPFSLL